MLITFFSPGQVDELKNLRQPLPTNQTVNYKSLPIIILEWIYVVFGSMSPSEDISHCFTTLSSPTL